MPNPLHPTPPLPDEPAKTRTGYAVATALVALALFAAALGEGSPDTPPEDRLPHWVDVASNVASAGLGVLVLVPKTRRVACFATAAMMLVAMAVNYQMDGPDFFLQALPFNLVTLTLAIVVARRHRAQAS